MNGQANSHTNGANVSHLLAKFFTKNKKYKVPEIPISIPANSTPTVLNELVNQLIDEEKRIDVDDAQLTSAIEFAFIVNNEIVQTSLEQFLSERPEISSESVIEIEFSELFGAPEPSQSIPLDDWISSVRESNGLVLIGCYNNTVQVCNVDGELLNTFDGHTGAVKAVSWISTNEDSSKFISASHDQSLIVWNWNRSKNSIEEIELCIGHKESVECVDVNSVQTRFISGSWDSMLKLWSLTDNFPDESVTKKSKGDIQTKAKTPELTLDGHTQNISSCKWLTDTQVCTASWDHTIKLWDLSTAKETQTITSANKIFLSIDHSKKNNLLLATVNDRHIRLYDPRSQEGSLVKSTFTSHNGWCTSVSWSKTRENLFVSSSYDEMVKLWDIRSPKTSLYDLSGHEDKVFSVDWSSSNNILSGSADNTVKIFKTTDSVEIAKTNGHSTKMLTKLNRNKAVKNNNHR